MKRILSWSLAVLLACGAGLIVYFYATTGIYGLNVLLRRGGSIWPAVVADDRRLSPSMRLALSDHVPAIAAGELSWDQIRPGFQVGELPVLADGHEVDRILLTKVDPQYFRFAVRNEPSGDRDLQDWMKETGAALVINGSYYGMKGRPDTPFLSDGAELGPSEYDGAHGAFVASADGARLVDLAGSTWQQAFAGADNALVSYPILIGADGKSRTKPSHWLANRSFVGSDDAGHIVLGTTRDAFFSLDRLAGFLRRSPLHLSLALNLDGGPVACQGVSLGGFERDFCGDWELAVRDNALYLLQPLIGRRRWALPIVLAVFPK
ncbi:Predicted protein [Rhizobiales bacterium GAS191]|nr:Predicted protein [Rhizobiales bacterium GAS191]